MSDLSFRVERWQDYLEITKPRVVLLMVLCAIVGMLLASPTIADIDNMIFGLIGMVLIASSAAAVNHVADVEIDGRMKRTERRPVVRGRVSSTEGLLFAAILAVLGSLMLFFLVNPLTAWLNVASWIGYASFYTLYLKRATSHNIVIGGLFGAAPPLLGWASVTGTVEWGAVVLVLIIFLWTPPHFWALALDRKEDYENTDIPMLPITHGETHTRWQILVYSVLLLLSTFLPWVIGMSGVVYLLCAAFLGVVFIGYCCMLLVRSENAKLPKATFKYSIYYLGLLFLALVGDHLYTLYF